MTSVFFNNFNHFGEQNLIDSLIEESISIYGHTIFYCPRKINNKDDIYGEDAVSSYESAYIIDAYIKSYDAYEGQGNFFSKFNMEIKDNITFCIGRRRFNNDIGIEEGLERPREGDLLYSDTFKRLFKITYVNDKPVFYQMGALQFYDIKAEVFEYSSEKLRTGISQIDAIELKYTTDSMSYTLPDVIDFELQNQDILADNLEINTAANGIVDFSRTNPFLS
jgi:hypothetical protein